MKNTLFKALQSKKLSMEIVQQFLSLIVGNKLIPGDRLPSEMELSKAFNVSRGTLREALKSLEHFNLITVKQGSGAYVNEYGLDMFLKQLGPVLFLGKNEIIDLMEIRKILEVYGVGASALNANEEDKKLIKIELSAMEDNLHNYDRFIEHDVNFHMLVSKSSRNAVLPKIIEAIRLLYLKQQREVVSKPGAAKRALQFHKDIFKAIVEKKMEVAKKKMLEHLEDIEMAILSSQYRIEKTESHE